MTTLEVSTGRARWTGALSYIAMIALAIGMFLVVQLIGEGSTAPALDPEFATARVSVAANTVGLDTGAVVLHLVVTIAAMIALGTLLGRICRRFGQPAVVGEIIAGLVLGPSVLGAISPSAMELLIPSAASDPQGRVTGALKAISQIGVIFYMFMVGLELDLYKLQHQARSVIAIAHASIIVPFVLGSALSLAAYPALSRSGVPFISFSLFLGVAMAVTALPVLARILSDQRIEKTELGMLSLSCAAVSDVTIWCVLAVVVGMAQAELGAAAVVTVGAILFIGAMLLVIRPMLVNLSDKIDCSNRPSTTALVIGTTIVVLLSGFATHEIGIHALFGAFLLGAILPHESRISHAFTAKLHEPVTRFLLPAFFAYTGMRTKIDQLSGSEALFWCATIIVVAVVGKLGGTTVAARLSGYRWRDATALGVLMNTRGLMELIVLNIGLELGIISEALFTMMVLMAIVTTLMTVFFLRRIIDLPDVRR